MPGDWASTSWTDSADTPLLYFTLVCDWEGLPLGACLGPLVSSLFLSFLLAATIASSHGLVDLSVPLCPAAWGFRLGFILGEEGNRLLKGVPFDPLLKSRTGGPGLVEEVSFQRDQELHSRYPEHMADSHVWGE